MKGTRRGPALVLGDGRVLDADLVGEALDLGAEETAHGLDQVRVIGDDAEDLFLLGGALDARDQGAAAGGLVALGVQHLEVAGRPVGCVFADLDGSVARGLHQAGGDQSLDHAEAVVAILPDVLVSDVDRHAGPHFSREQGALSTDGVVRGGGGVYLGRHRRRV